MQRPRLAPGTRREIGTLAWLVSRAAGRLAGTGPPNLFLTLGRNRPLFRAWLRFASRLMPRGSLPRRETELVILRVARRNDCTYEFEHHVRLARRAGVDRGDVQRVVSGPEAPGWSPRERVILRAVDELHDRRDLTDETWAELRVRLGEAEIIELLLLAGSYESLATTIAALRIEPDTPSRPG